MKKDYEGEERRTRAPRGWQSPTVLVALLTSIGSTVTTVYQNRAQSEDQRDAYKTISEVVNQHQRAIGRLEGEIDGIRGGGASWNMGRGGGGAIAGAPLHAHGPALDIGEVTVVGHLDAGPEEDAGAKKTLPTDLHEAIQLQRAK